MQTEIIIAGFGGQGVLFAGQLLSYTAMDTGREVTWIPSYGPEMRGGTANCTVIISDEEIGSPLVLNPTAVLAMNLPSLDKYESLIKPEGFLVVNKSMVNRSPVREDINSIIIPASEIAENFGDHRLVNMIMLGGLLSILPILDIKAIQQALGDHLIKNSKPLYQLNIDALQMGLQYSPKLTTNIL